MRVVLIRLRWCVGLVGLITSDADVGSFEVRFQVVGTRFIPGELGVWNAHPAAPSTGTSPVGGGDHVRRAADVTVVHLDAPAQLHPAVARMRHEDHVIGGTRGVERLRLAVRRKPLAGCGACRPHYNDILATKLSYSINSSVGGLVVSLELVGNHERIPLRPRPHQQQCRSNRQHCRSNVRLCCWCGRGLTLNGATLLTWGHHAAGQ